jgi:proline dehydrogenase
VAGEELDDGLRAVRELASSGRSATLDYLGEAVTSMEEAGAACDVYLKALRRIGADGLDCGVSVKPTQMGLEVDTDGCRELIGRIAAACDAAGVHLCLDMEGTDVTEETVALVEWLRAQGHDDVGCAVQSYLHRTRDDVERLSRAGASLRLCKGAYAETESVAYQSRRDVDVSYARCGDYLLREGRYPRLATHDGRLISYLRYAAGREGRSPGEWEFQMLYGVREDLQTELVSEGLSLRVYVPFGEQWYPYFARRIAERPANAVFFLRALVGRS